MRPFASRRSSRWATIPGGRVVDYAAGRRQQVGSDVEPSTFARTFLAAASPGLRCDRPATERVTVSGPVRGRKVLVVVAARRSAASPPSAHLLASSCQTRQRKRCDKNTGHPPCTLPSTNLNRAGCAVFSRQRFDPCVCERNRAVNQRHRANVSDFRRLICFVDAQAVDSLVRVDGASPRQCCDRAARVRRSPAASADRGSFAAREYSDFVFVVYCRIRRPGRFIADDADRLIRDRVTLIARCFGCDRSSDDESALRSQFRG